jgi:hypothetical protein
MGTPRFDPSARDRAGPDLSPRQSALPWTLLDPCAHLKVVYTHEPKPEAVRPESRRRHEPLVPQSSHRVGSAHAVRPVAARRLAGRPVAPGMGDGARRSSGLASQAGRLPAEGARGAPSAVADVAHGRGDAAACGGVCDDAAGDRRPEDVLGFVTMLAEVIIGAVTVITLGSLWFAAVVTAPERPRKRRLCASGGLFTLARCETLNDVKCETGRCPYHCKYQCRCQK